MKRSNIFTFIFIFGLAAKAASSEHILRSPERTSWGDWGAWESCPQGDLVIGMRLKTEQPQGSGVRHPNDDTALNAIALICGNPRTGQVSRQITSSEGIWGSWGTQSTCRSGMYAKGFQLRSENPQGGDDDTAANNLRLFCGNAGSESVTLTGDGFYWGDWTQPQHCPANMGICGISTQLEAPQGHREDDTSLNNLKVKCCDV